MYRPSNTSMNAHGPGKGLHSKLPLPRQRSAADCQTKGTLALANRRVMVEQLRTHFNRCPSSSFPFPSQGPVTRPNGPILSLHSTPSSANAHLPAYSPDARIHLMGWLLMSPDEERLAGGPRPSKDPKRKRGAARVAMQAAPTHSRQASVPRREIKDSERGLNPFIRVWLVGKCLSS